MSGAFKEPSAIEQAYKLAKDIRARNSASEMSVEESGKSLFNIFEPGKSWKEYMAIHCHNTIEGFKSKVLRYKVITIDMALLEYYEDDCDRKWALETGVEPIYHRTLSKMLLDEPDKAFRSIRAAIDDIKPEYKAINVEIRLSNVNVSVQLRDVRMDNVNRLCSITCTVSKMGQVRPVLLEGAYECARCKNIIIVPQVPGEAENKPTYCPCNEEKKGIFRLVESESRFDDYQLLRLMETVESCTDGEQPQTVDARFINDLCGSLVPGERVVIYGIPRIVTKRDGRGMVKTNRDLIIEVLGYKREDRAEFTISAEDVGEIKKLAESPDIKDKIARSIASSIHGHDDMKRAIALSLVGGVQKRFDDGTRQRGTSNLLIVGDPGIAKSVIAKAASRLSVKCTYLSGKGASGAGLTAAAVKDNFGGSGWSLEAGALPLNNKGVVVMDEFDKLSENDRDCLHGALEDQVIDFAKAGLRAKLKCDTTLIAIANPICGRFDEHEDVAEQINVKPSLLSRFDIIYVARDVVNEDNDELIASAVINAHTLGQRREQLKNKGYDEELAPVSEDEKRLKPEIPEDLLKKYLEYARRNVFPAIPDDDVEIKQYLIDAYKGLRTDNYSIKATPRQLGGLIRLAEASARLRLSEKISREDIDDALKLYVSALDYAARSEGKVKIQNIVANVTSSQGERIRAIIDFIRANDRGDGVRKKAIVSGLSVNYNDASLYRTLTYLQSGGKVIEVKDGILKLSIQ